MAGRSLSSLCVRGCHGLLWNRQAALASLLGLPERCYPHSAAALAASSTGPGAQNFATAQAATLLSKSYGFAAAASIPTLQQQAPAPQQPVASPETYTVKIVTGNLRGAGTHSQATIQLIGSNGTSERILIGGDLTGVLGRGSTRTITVPVPQHIGTIRRVFVEKQRESSSAGEGWYLQLVEVEDSTGERTVFPCNAWLGESDCGMMSGGLRHLHI